MERIGDPLKIFQILLNLINNGVKFTQSGSITLAIKEDYRVEGGLILTVIDTGIGISENHQKIIFDRFTQANDSLSQQHGGAGLGLAISQKLTNAMGGQLMVKSVLGRGSIFSCHLPLPPAAPSDRRRLRLDASLIPPENFPELKILVVDDIKENIDVIKMYLQDYPVRIRTAANGKDALKYYTAEMFDIILMDIRMPVMDGITATQEIRDMEKLEDNRRADHPGSDRPCLSGTKKQISQSRIRRGADQTFFQKGADTNPVQICNQRAGAPIAGDNGQ